MQTIRSFLTAVSFAYLIMFGNLARADDVSITAAITTSTGQKTMVTLNREKRLYDVVVTHGEPAIAFTVKNTSNHDVSLGEQLLPTFAGSGRLVLTAAWKWGDSLPAMAPPPIDYDRPVPGDPLPKPTILKPGESKIYVVPLSLRIDDLAEARKKGDMVVFWYFEAFDITARKRVGDSGGWFDMPKAN